jgi:hypothetical protein
MNRRRVSVQLVALALAGGNLPGCAAVPGPRSVTISEEELTRHLAQRFPVDRRLLDWIDLRLETPRVVLRPDTNRVAVEMGFEIRERLSQRSFPLQIGLDSALRYDAGSGAVVLSDVKVRHLGVAGLPKDVAPVVLQLGAPLAERLLEGMPIHRFTQQQLTSAAGQGLRPDSIRVTPKGVQMTLIPLEVS